MMDRASIGASIASLLLLTGVIGFYVVSRDSGNRPAPEYSLEKHLRYSFTLRNTSDQFIKDSIFRAFAPVKQNSWQRVDTVAASLPFTLIEDRFGNQVMEFAIAGIPPYGTKVIIVTVGMSLSEHPNVDDGDTADYLLDSPLLSINHPDIAAQAERIASQSGSLGEAVNRWARGHVRYSGFDPEDRGALYALHEGKGDCTEYSQLVTALMRHEKVPARTVGGFVTTRDRQVLRASDYHNWSEYRRDDRWILADAQNGIHDDAYEQYIAFRIIEKEEGNPMSNSHRFLAFDDRLAVSMN